MIKFLALMAMAPILLVSCGTKQEKAGGPSTQGTGGGTVLATVNGETLTYQDLQLQLQVPPEYRDKLRGQDLQSAIDTWINTMLLAQLGEKMGIDKSSEVAAVMRFRRADAIARRLVELEITNKTNVTPAEIDSAYDADKENFKITDDGMQAKHILLGSKEEAEAVYIRLKKGDDFAKLAMDYSIDRQSAAIGGDLPVFTAAQADQFDPAFGRAVKKLKVGEYSEPVKTAYGYHIIKLTDIVKAGTSMDSVEVKNKISEDLKTAKQSQAFSELIQSLKAKARIEMFTPPGLDLDSASYSEGQ
jgi:peptidyl-prolyl cis-trans isomerase C